MKHRSATPVPGTGQAVTTAADRPDAILPRDLGGVTLFAPADIASHDIRVVAEPGDKAEDVARKEELVRLLVSGVKA